MEKIVLPWRPSAEMWSIARDELLVNAWAEIWWKLIVWLGKSYGWDPLC